MRVCPHAADRLYLGATGVRPLVHDEPPKGRRLNVVGALAPRGPAPSLVWACTPGKFDAAALLDFRWHQVAGLTTAVGEVPADYHRARPCVVVLDNYSVHRSKAVKEVEPALAQAGLSFFFLPPYSSELNRIEPLWRQVKYQDLPGRSYQTIPALQTAVEGALTTHADRLSNATTNFAEAA